MIKQTYFCDTCLKEFNPQEGISTLAGILLKMTDKLEKQTYRFEGNYCGECSELLLNFIATLKTEIQARAS